MIGEKLKNKFPIFFIEIPTKVGYTFVMETTRFYIGEKLHEKEKI
jgi:hypothetical protein